MYCSGVDRLSWLTESKYKFPFWRTHGDMSSHFFSFHEAEAVSQNTRHVKNSELLPKYKQREVSSMFSGPTPGLATGAL